MVKSDLREIAYGLEREWAYCCDRIAVAGSVRRGKIDPKDVEVVCIPREEVVAEDLFSEPIVERDVEFVEALKKWCIVKGEPEKGRYVKLVVQDGVRVDVFICRPENWGVIFAIRTGPAEFSHRCIAKRAHRHGLRIQGGMLTEGGEVVTCGEEKDLFGRLGMPWIEPSERGESWVLDKYGVF